PEGGARALGVAEPADEARGAAALALENRRGPREQVELRAPGAALSPPAAERARQRPLHRLLDAARNEGIERCIGQSCERARIAEPLPETLERRVQQLAPAVGRDAGLDALASRAPEPQLRVGAERALVLEIEAPRAEGTPEATCAPSGRKGSGCGGCGNASACSPATQMPSYRTTGSDGTGETVTLGSSSAGR